MTWRRHYEIAQSLHERAEILFSLGEILYAGEGIWGLRHLSQAMTHRYGRVDGHSFEQDYIPGGCNREERVGERRRKWSAAINLHHNFYHAHLPEALAEQNRVLQLNCCARVSPYFSPRNNETSGR